MLKRFISSLVGLAMLLTLVPAFALEQPQIVAERDQAYPCALKVIASGVTAPITGNVFLAGYQDDARLSSVDAKPILIAENGEQTIPFDIPKEGGNYKFFTWDADQKPLTAVTPITVESYNIAEGKAAQAIWCTNPVGSAAFLTDGKTSETEFWGEADGASSAACYVIDLLTPVTVSDISVHIPQAATALYSDDPDSGNISISLSNNADVAADEDVEGTFFKKPDVGWHSAKVKASGKFRFVKIRSFTGKAIGLSEIKVTTTTPEQQGYDLAKAEFTKVTQLNGNLSADSINNVIDGDLNTSWTATQTYTEFEIDLGEEFEISQVKVISPDGADTAKRYYIQFMNETKSGANYYVTDFNNSEWRTFSITDTTPVRYLKFTSEGAGGIAFSEIQIQSFKKPTITNIATSPFISAVLDKATAPNGVTASGSPMNMLDGDLSTDWAAANVQTVVLIDLGKAYNVSDVRTIAKAGVPNGHYYIQFLGAAQNLIATVDDNSRNEWRSFPTTSYGPIRYMKLWSNNDGGVAASLAEIKILSTDTPPACYNLAASPATKISFNPAHTGSGTAAGKLENIIDENVSTTWAANENQTVFDIDLGKNFTLSSVRTLSQEGAPAAHYYIQFWNEAGALLNTVEDDTRSDWTMFGVPSEPVRYLRVWSNFTSASFAEIKVLSMETPIATENIALKAEGAILAGPSGIGALKNAFDGDVSTAWTADAGSSVEYKITFDKAYNVSQLRVISAKDADPNALYYIVFYDAQGQMIQQGAYYLSDVNKSDWNFYTVNAGTPVSAIRFTNSAASQISIAEVQVFTAD